MEIFIFIAAISVVFVVQMYLRGGQIIEERYRSDVAEAKVCAREMGKEDAGRGTLDEPKTRSREALMNIAASFIKDLKERDAKAIYATYLHAHIEEREHLLHVYKSKNDPEYLFYGLK